MTATSALEALSVSVAAAPVTPRAAKPATEADAHFRSLLVLVVDDQDMQRLVARRALTRMGHRVVEAASGEEALERLAEHPVDVILCDWVMDGMDGTELCGHLRQRDHAHYTYFILMSSRDGREDMIEGMSSGADDFLRKPLDVDELGVRLRAGQRVLDLQARLQKRQQELSHAYDRIQDDIRAAGVFQRALLPRPNAEACQHGVAWLFLPSNLVSGDALQYFEIDPDRLAFYLMDVSGHGVAAAMVAMNVAQYLNPRVEGCIWEDLRCEDRVPLAPEAAVSAVNARLCRQDIDGRYLTCVYGMLDRRTGRVQLVRAGHPPPLLVHADGAPSERLDEGDMPVALFPEAEYASHDMQLRPGSRLAIYSDGLIECENGAKEAYGVERLLAFLERTATLPLQQVPPAFVEEIGAWKGAEHADFDDDLSLMLIEFNPALPIVPALANGVQR